MEEDPEQTRWETPEDPEQTWWDVLESHREEWKRAAGGPPGPQLELLDRQLEAYYGCPHIGKAAAFLTGTGCDRPRVVVVTAAPYESDARKRTAFPESTWVNLMETDFAKAAGPDRCYFMYCFPFPVKSEKSEEGGATMVRDFMRERLFLPYALRRLAVLQPKLVVFAARQAATLLGKRLGGRRGVVLPFDAKGLDCSAIACPHPYAALQEKGERGVWDECMKLVDAFLAPFRVQGPKMIDRADGLSKTDAFAVMRAKASIPEKISPAKPVAVPEIATRARGQREIEDFAEPITAEERARRMQVELETRPVEPRPPSPPPAVRVTQRTLDLWLAQ